MKILTAAEMQACDRLTTDQFRLPPSQLMHSAAQAVADYVRQQFPTARRITALCGRGNNGGDGLIASRLLAESGLELTVVLLGDPATLQGLPAQAWTDLVDLAERLDTPSRLRLHPFLSEERLAQHRDDLFTDLIIDAVVGTGFHPPLRGLPLAALEWLKETSAPILAVDLPSGWDADSHQDCPTMPAYPADAVITFTAPKPAHLFGQLTHSITQPIVVAPIGSPEQAIISALNLHWAGSSKVITDPERPADSNKGMYGHVLVIGGSVGKSGAPGMAALSALRTGAGLVTAGLAPSVLPLVAQLAPELMTYALAVDSSGQFSSENLQPASLEALLHKITVLAIGPGLGTTPESVDFALGLLSASRLPAVVDADALNALAANLDRLPAIAKDRTLVLTPHPGEMGRLLGISTQAVQADRLNLARDFAVRNGVTLVLKGWRTLIAHPDGSVAINTTGNPAMAKGGSGDLLTGMVASLLAQHPSSPKEAVEAAVYLHGLSADIAVRAQDQHTLLATDALAYLAQAFRYHPRTGKGYVWLQGFPQEVTHPGPTRAGAQ